MLHFLAAPLKLLSVLCCLHSGLIVGGHLSKPEATHEASEPVMRLIAQGKALRNAGRIEDAIAVFIRADDTARASKDRPGEARSLIFLGSTQITAHRYRAALESLQSGKSVADQLNDIIMLGAASGNISTIYSQLGDWTAAYDESARAIEYLRRNSDHLSEEADRDKRPGLLAKALVSHAFICFVMGRSPEGFKDSEEALRLATSTRNDESRAQILDAEGTAFFRENKLKESDQALHQALALDQQIGDKEDLAFVEEHLAELETRKPRPNYQLALQLIDDAFAAHNRAFDSSPQYYPIHTRAQILLGSGNRTSALAEFMRAVTAADQWRMGALPGDTTNTQTVAELQGVYADYAHLAADIAIEKKDNALAVSALEVLCENRAASLREQLRRDFSSTLKLPAEYFYKLAQLQSAQAEVTLGQNAAQDQLKLAEIRLQLSDLENRIGLNPEKTLGASERIPRRNSLRNIQHKLGRDQVLLSISLGKSRSYMWAVTGEAVNLSSLPGEEELTSESDTFAASVRAGQSSAGVAGKLSHQLFAGLPADVWNRSEWMIVADGPLLSGIPFCVLPDPASGKPLIQTKGLRFLPSELLLLDRHSSAASSASQRRFVGIGDPIYNSADGRLVRARYADAKSVTKGADLARLVGSEKEIRSAAKSSGFPQNLLLTGAQASRENVEKALATGPDVVHFAVHVVSPPKEPQQAALALSLKAGFPELLTPEVVSSFHTPGSLVVLSGCASGQGKFVPGAGLVGLGRAWLLAGAAAVVVSDWPTPDDSGRFFSSFYSHFDENQSGGTAQRAALALRRTQIDMLNGSGYQTSPAFWGAFAIISKE